MYYLNAGVLVVATNNTHDSHMSIAMTIVELRTYFLAAEVQTVMYI